MKTLAQLLTRDDARRERVVHDCVNLVEEHIASRGALRRVTLGVGLAMLKAVKPDALERAVTMLLPDFARSLEPLFQRFQASDQRDFSQFLLHHSDAAATALIQVTDQRAEAVRNTAAKKAYAYLRESAEGEVRAALPALAGLLGRHIQDA